MAYLERNTLPKFQERLDLAASELNDMEDIIVEAINELAGRVYIINNLVPAEDRAQYASEENYKIIDTITSIMERQTSLEESIAALNQEVQNFITSQDDRYAELDRRLNALDDAAARKKDLNAVLYRTGRE